MGAPGFGLFTTPIMIGTLVLSSMRLKKKGRSTEKMGVDIREMMTAVAAAASAPSSFSSMLDLWLTLDTNRGPSVIPARLGFEKIAPRPVGGPIIEGQLGKCEAIPSMVW